MACQPPTVFRFPPGVFLLMTIVMLPLPLLFLISLVESVAFRPSHDPVRFFGLLAVSAFLVWLYCSTVSTKIIITDVDVFSENLFGKDVISKREIKSCKVVSNSRGTSWLEIKTDGAVVEIAHSFLRDQLQDIAACISENDVA